MSAIPSSTDAADWLPATKLSPPSLGGDIIARPNLLQTFHQTVMSHRLTLVLAPAGYGKSALLSAWVTELRRCRNDGDAAQHVAWLSLDGSENDRTHFLLGLIAALRTLHPACGVRAQLFLTENGRPEPFDVNVQMQVVAGLIIIDVQEYLPEAFVLVLDNYEHMTDPTVRTVMDYLVARLPSQARIVIASSRVPPLPLARMALHGQATQFALTSLAFDARETAHYLEQVLGIEFPQTHSEALCLFTEGWPVGIRLIAQELRRLPDDKARIAYIEALTAQKEDPPRLMQADAFFREELYDPLPRTLQTFMLQTAVLPTLSAAKCRALTGRADAAQLLQKLRRRNLFLAPVAAELSKTGENPVGGHTEAYRYHRLCAAFLRRLLWQEMPGDAPALHRQAAELTSDRPQQVRHYLAAGAYHEAVAAIVQSWKQQQTTLDLQTLAGWIEAIPKPVLQAHPDLEEVCRASGLTTGSAGAPWGLTDRQIEVLDLLSEGATNQDIADALVISLSTVKGHISQILQKLNVKSRHEAASRVSRSGT